jgi:hypothetical protein
VRLDGRVVQINHPLCDTKKGPNGVK